MTRITGEIVIGAPAEVVFDFVADQRNEPAYNPHMVRCAKVTPGPVGKGTQFRSAVRSGTGHSQRWRVSERSPSVFLSAG
jgi:Polyketide cyclase / dehydrase and lipid transport